VATRSLRSRFVVVFLGLVLIVTTLGLSVVDYAIRHNAREQLAAELATSERVFRRILADSTARLAQAASVLSADFAFRTAVATGDRDTVISALANHGDRIDADLMMIIDRDGLVTASTSSDTPTGSPFPKPALFERARDGGGAAGFMIRGDRLYQTVLAPVQAPTTIGWVAMSFEIDARMARELSELTSTELVFVLESAAGDWHVVGAGDTEGARTALLTPLRSDRPRDAVPHAVGDDLLLASMLDADSDSAAAVLRLPLATALAPFAPLQRFLFVLAIGALTATAAGSALLARGITRPLSQLAEVARVIANGDYSRAATVERDDEVGALARAVNAMREGIAMRESTIMDLAYRDPLTRLPNRALFLERAEQALTVASGRDGRVAVLLLGVDNFRYVTHTLGHQLGERLLGALALRLDGLVPRRVDTLARVGGEQFAVLLDGADTAAASVMATRLLQALEEPFRIDEQIVDLGVSIGLVEFPAHGEDVATLLQHAELALSVARRARTDYAVYEPGFDQSPERLSLLGELRRAVEGDQLVLFYQPKLDLRSGEPAYVEALVRWQHPVRGFVPPDKFIPFAEQTGYIRVLTLWVLNAALRQCAAWQRRGIGLRMCVNLSARDLMNADLPHVIRRLLDELALDPGLIWLEITESAIMEDPVRAQQVINALDGMGLRLSIDDFGTGYSSLAYLKRLPVDELKIDKAFVLTMDRDQDDATIVRSTIELGHNLGLTVVAEGVDSERALALLREWGCDVAQGFHICRPLPPEQLEAWLASPDSRRFEQRAAQRRLA